VVSIALPKKIEERSKEEAERTGASEEELIVEALAKAFNENLDPEVRIEIHLKLSEKFLKEAEELLRKGDLTQASEKAWGGCFSNRKGFRCKRGEGA